jgi:hypothetical protein
MLFFVEELVRICIEEVLKINYRKQYNAFKLVLHPILKKFGNNWMFI